MVTFFIEDGSGSRQALEIPDDMNLSLMEVLKASEYAIPATCGGMALCATCHVEVLQGDASLKEATDAELDMLDTLPQTRPGSRLACQIRISQALSGSVFRLAASDADY